MTSDDQPITRRDLTEAFGEFGREFGASLMSEFRQELDAKLLATENRFTGQLDAKLLATENRITEKLMNFTEETIGRSNAELLENIASIIDPMQNQIEGHEKRITKLEHRTA